MSDKSVHSVNCPDWASDPLKRLQTALQCADELVFEWHLPSDEMVWSDGADQTLNLSDASSIKTGAGFAKFLSPESLSQRQQATQCTLSPDNVYSIEYQFNSEDGRSCWLEERGHCVPGADGTAERVIGLIKVVTNRKRMEERLTYLASFDELTGHLNRSRLRGSLEAALTDAHRTQSSLAYLVVGIDDLAVINETYGFDIADEVIAQTGNVLQECLRSDDIIGRSAGNKFGLILPNTSERQMMEMAEWVRSNVRGSVFRTKAGAVSATVSVGGVLLPIGGHSSQEAMAHGEEALEDAKSSGRDAFKVYRASPQRSSLRRRTAAIADQVVSALNDRRLVLAYQPIVCARTGEVMQNECLLRLMAPDGTIMVAGDFIPVAEQLGLVRLVDQRVLELSVETLRSHPDMELALNVSGMTATDPSWLGAFVSNIRSNRDVADRLTLELTETVAIHDIESSARFVASLRDLGCKVAIDDFGAGYTSFRNLQMLDVDMVKIDGSFIRGLSDNPDNQLFVRTLVDLAANFNLDTVAEWVATEEDADLLRSYGVDYFQGFLYVRKAGNQPGMASPDGLEAGPCHQ